MKKEILLISILCSNGLFAMNRLTQTAWFLKGVPLCGKSSSWHQFRRFHGEFGEGWDPKPGTIFEPRIVSLLEKIEDNQKETNVLLAALLKEQRDQDKPPSRRHNHTHTFELRRGLYMQEKNGGGVG